MGRHVIDGNPPIAVELRRSVRARRLSLRISRIDGRVTLTLPKRAAESEGIAFANAREDWIRHHLAGQTEPWVPQIGKMIPLEGRMVRISASDRQKGVRLDGDALWVPNDPTRVGVRLAAFLKLRARDALAQASDKYSSELGVGYGRITLRDTRSRWGSCSSNGDLMYSWRLIMAPTKVLDYVAAHEVAHLKEMNHSPAFWSLVSDLCPEYTQHRDWLRHEGDNLHRIRFTD